MSDYGRIDEAAYQPYFSWDEIKRIIVSNEEIELAKKHGEKIEVKNREGKATVYVWQNRFYITGVEVVPEIPYSV
jgi:hypothetical protein